MTTRFVDDTATYVTGLTEADAHETFTVAVVGAMAVAVAGDVLKVRNTHNETSGVGAAGARTIVFPATPGLQILSVAFDGSGTGALTAGATIDVGAANSALTLTSGFVYVNGVTFGSGTNNNNACDINFGNSNAAAIVMFFDNCTIDMNSVATGAQFAIGSNTGGAATLINITCINCTYIGGSSASIFVKAGTIYLRNFTLTGTAPTTVFDLAGADKGLDLTVDASDLSGVAYTNLVSAAGVRPGLALFRNNKFRASTSLTTGAFAGPGSYSVVAVDCNSGDVQYQYLKESYEGTIVTSDSIYQSASNGTKSFSLLGAGNANTTFVHTLNFPEFAGFFSAGTAIEPVIECTNDGTVFSNAQLWVERLAKTTSGVPLGTWNISDRVANILTTGTDQANSTATWTGTGGFTYEVGQKLEPGSFTPAEEGEVTCLVRLAANDNVYVSPKLVASSGRQYLAGSGRFVSERASDGSGGTRGYAF